jgi:hypothetical protein
MGLASATGVMTVLVDKSNAQGCQRVLTIRLNQTSGSTFTTVNLEAIREGSDYLKTTCRSPPGGARKCVVAMRAATMSDEVALGTGRRTYRIVIERCDETLQQELDRVEYIQGACHIFPNIHALSWLPWLRLRAS